MRGGKRGRGVHSGLLLCHQVSSLRERLESANSALQEEVRGRAEEQLQQREATERAAQEKAMLERDLSVARWREREGGRREVVTYLYNQSTFSSPPSHLTPSHLTPSQGECPAAAVTAREAGGKSLNDRRGGEDPAGTATGTDQSNCSLAAGIGPPQFENKHIGRHSQEREGEEEEGGKVDR